MESDLKDAQKAYDDADSVRNTTKTALEKAQVEEKLAQGKLDAAKAVAKGTSEELERATDEWRPLDAKVTTAQSRRDAADKDLTKKTEAYDKRMNEELEPIKKGRDALQKSYTAADTARIQPKADYEAAKKKSEDLATLLTNYKTADANLQECNTAITTYETKERLKYAKEEAERKIDKDKLIGKADSAKSAHDAALKSKDEIDKNEILNGASADLDKTTIKLLVKLRDNAVKTAKPVNLAKAEQELKTAKELEKYDKSLVKSIRKNFHDLLQDAEEKMDNDFLNGAINDDAIKLKTVSEVVAIKKAADTAARSKHDMKITQTDLDALKQTLEEMRTEYSLIRTLRTIDKTKTVKDLKAEFKIRKSEADKTITLCETNDFLNGNIMNDFKAETIDQAVQRLKTDSEKARAEYEKAAPAEQLKLAPNLKKVEKEYTFMQELGGKFGKKMTVEDAKTESKRLKTEADIVVNQYNTNGILNGAIKIDKYAGAIIGTLESTKHSNFIGFETDYTTKKNNYDEFKKAEKELKLIQQLETKFGGSKTIDELQKTFKATGESEANSLIKHSNENAFLKRQNSNKKYDDKLVAEAEAELEQLKTTARNALANEKDAGRKNVLREDYRKADDDLVFMQQLKEYDNMLIGDLKQKVPNMKNEAAAAVKKAEGEKKIADDKLEEQNKIIRDADVELNGVDMQALRSKHREAVPKKPDLEKQFNGDKAKLDVRAKQDNINVGDADWENKLTAISTQLDAETTRLLNIFTPLDNAATAINTKLTKKTTEETEKIKDIQKNEEAWKTAAEKALIQADKDLAEATKNREQPAATMEAARIADEAAKALLPPLVEAAATANELVMKAKANEFDAMTAQNEMKTNLDKARTKKDEADREAERLEREHQYVFFIILNLEKILFIAHSASDLVP